MSRKSAPLLDTGSATVGTTVSGSTTRDIPLYGRSYFGLVFLSGGVTESPGSGISDNYPSGTNFISNGQRNATAEVRLDGALTSAPEQGEGGNSNVYYQPSVEVIQEFKVANNSFSAEFGNNGGTVLNVLMKQGGNAFHGSGWWFGQRSGLDANDFFSNAAGLPRPDHKHDQYGFMVNGPIRKEKTFFLFDLERLKDSSPLQIATTVPTLAERQGDFSQSYYADEDGNPVPNIIYDPQSGPPGARIPFASNVIPSRQIDSIGAAVAALYPQPNQPGDPLLETNNFRTNVLSASQGYQLDAKIDQQITSNQHFSVRYSHLHNTYNTPTVLGSGDFGDGVDYETTVHNAAVELHLDHTPQPSARPPHRTRPRRRARHLQLSRPAQGRLPRHPDRQRSGPHAADQHGRRTVHRPVHAMLRGYRIRAHALQLLGISKLGARVALHQVRRRAAHLLQQFLPARFGHRHFRLFSDHHGERSPGRRYHAGKSDRGPAARLRVQRLEYHHPPARRRQIHGDRVLRARRLEGLAQTDSQSRPAVRMERPIHRALQSRASSTISQATAALPCPVCRWSPGPLLGTTIFPTSGHREHRGGSQ